MAIPEIHVNAWHIRRKGDEFIVTIGSSDAKTLRLIIGINHALDFINKIEAALNEVDGNGTDVVGAITSIVPK